MCTFQWVTLLNFSLENVLYHFLSLYRFELIFHEWFDRWPSYKRFKSYVCKFIILRFCQIFWHYQGLSLLVIVDTFLIGQNLFRMSTFVVTLPGIASRISFVARAAITFPCLLIFLECNILKLNTEYKVLTYQPATIFTKFCFTECNISYRSVRWSLS